MADKKYNITPKGTRFLVTVGMMDRGNKRIAKWILLAIGEISRGQSRAAKVSTKSGIKNEINIRPESFEKGWSYTVSQKLIR